GAGATNKSSLPCIRPRMVSHFFTMSASVSLFAALFSNAHIMNIESATYDFFRRGSLRAALIVALATLPLETHPVGQTGRGRRRPAEAPGGSRLTTPLAGARATARRCRPRT